MTWLELVAGGLVGLGGVLLVVAALGVLVLPDALARQHAATKAATLALGLILGGTVIVQRDPAWTLRLGTILVFLFATLPVGSHMLARAAAREAGLWEGPEPPTPPPVPDLQGPAEP